MIGKETAFLGARSIRKDLPMNNEQIIRRAYELAEKADVKGWAECFTPDGTLMDMSVGVTYRGPDGPTGVGKTVGVNPTLAPLFVNFDLEGKQKCDLTSRKTEP
jgi:ketosteroid isomerase-like protein